MSFAHTGSDRLGAFEMWVSLISLQLGTRLPFPPWLGHTPCVSQVGWWRDPDLASKQKFQHLLSCWQASRCGGWWCLGTVSAGPEMATRTRDSSSGLNKWKHWKQHQQCTSDWQQLSCVNHAQRLPIPLCQRVIYSQLQPHDRRTQ